MISKIKNTLYSIILWPIWYAYLIIILPIFLIFIIFVSKEYFHYFLRPMSYFFCLFGGQRLKVYGEIPDPKSGPYLYLMNHESLFDHFAIGRHIKHYVTAIAKFEQFKYPLWGHVAKYYGVEPIDRSNTKKAIKSLKNVEKEIIDNKTSFLIAPEGTRSKDGSLGEFKKGAFHLAKNTGASIIPIIINGAYEAKNINDWRLRPGTIKVYFSDSVSEDIYKNMSIEELRDYVREIIKEFVD
tara:strand:- start:927 stop:1646 length:720 start_codon:yes stop_codon:yes gene_type:complete